MGVRRLEVWWESFEYTHLRKREALEIGAWAIRGRADNGITILRMSRFLQRSGQNVQNFGGLRDDVQYNLEDEYSSHKSIGILSFAIDNQKCLLELSD